MPGRVRAWLLGAILAVLLGGVVLAVVRGDAAMTQLFMAPLGIITGALVWAEQHDKEKKGKAEEKKAVSDGESAPPRAPSGDGESS